MNTTNARHLSGLLAAVEAVAEDAAGVVHDVDPSTADRLHRLAPQGVGLPSLFARTLRREFDFDLGRIRLHVGPEVDAIARGLKARAFCLGTDIFLSRSILEDGSAATLDVLRHELTHVVADPASRRVRCWNHDVHAKLTEAACLVYRSAFEQLLRANEDVDVTGGVDGLIRGLAIASSNMDVRRRFAWSHHTYWDNLLFESLPTKLGLRNIIAGEGPAHGEGLDYQSTDWAANIKANVEEQLRHIKLAVREFKADQDSWIDDVLPEIRLGNIPILSRIFGPMTWLEKEWIKSLANALHIAQDRGSHREGVKGYGHSDPRTQKKPAFDPDAPDLHTHWAQDPYGRTWRRCNVAAYNKALNNSYEVIQEFLSRLGVRPGPSPVERENCGGEQARRREDQCVNGRLPGPLGARRDEYIPGGLLGPLHLWWDKHIAGRRPGPLDIRNG